MKVTIDEVYESAVKIASKTAYSFSKRNNQEVLLDRDELFGDMMIKLVEVITKDFNDMEHFYRNYKTSCVNLVKGKLNQLLFTKKSGFVEDENGFHRVNVASLDIEDESGHDFSQAIEDCSASITETIEEQERLTAVFKELSEDEDALKVFTQWVNPDEGLKEALSASEKSNSEISYHRIVRSHLKMTSDLYTYVRDLILATVRELYPQDCVRLGLA